MKNIFNKHTSWVAPLLGVFILSPFLTDWDITISNYFYRDGHFLNLPWLNFIYTYGVIPAQLTALLSLLALIGSYLFPRYAKWRKPAWTMVLSMAIGLGLVINLGLKDHWGRPRPRQVIEFGGTQPFRPFYQPQWDSPEPSKGFPCGHCAMGFYFLTPAYVCYRMKYYKWMAVFLGLALLLGGALSFTRIAQGGHFLSDVVFSLLIVWLFTLLSYWSANYAEADKTRN